MVTEKSIHYGIRHATKLKSKEKTFKKMHDYFKIKKNI